MHEHDLIRLFEGFRGAANPAVHIGIGDDAALIGASENLVITVDTLVEGQHFDMRFCDGENLGDKLLSVSVSDLAAKGARPQWCLVSCGLRSDVAPEFVREVYRGLDRRAQELGIAIAGGNVTRAVNEQWFDLFLAGRLEGSFKLRSAARVGDRVGVVGALGEAAAGFSVLDKLGSGLAKKLFPSLVLAQLRPRPALEAGIALSKIPGVHATIDLSDGLANELFHLSEASSVGFKIWDDRLCASGAMRDAAAYLNRDPLEWAWFGGEDYAILFTYQQGIGPSLTASGVGFTEIGEVVEADLGVSRLQTNGEATRVPRRGWDPFAIA